MRQRYLQNAAGIFAIAILLGFAEQASSDEIEAPKSVAEELLDILRAAGTIGEAQYQELRERARADETAFHTKLRLNKSATYSVDGRRSSVRIRSPPPLFPSLASRRLAVDYGDP